MADPPNSSAEPPQRIGHYKILEVLGEGGFGVVYLAEQTETVKRQVALKVIKPVMDKCRPRSSRIGRNNYR
jgi:serine/threonine protein kinase